MNQDEVVKHIFEKWDGDNEHLDQLIKNGLSSAEKEGYQKGLEDAAQFVKREYKNSGLVVAGIRALMEADNDDR